MDQWSINTSYLVLSTAAAFSDFTWRGMYQGLLTGAEFIDLHKAFDCVDHDLLNRMDLRTVN